MPVPKGPLNPSDEHRMVNVVKEMLTAEGANDTDIRLALIAAGTFSPQFYELAHTIRHIERISTDYAERVAYLGLKIVLTQVKEYQKMEGT